jgi:hypothetical protein
LKDHSAFIFSVKESKKEFMILNIVILGIGITWWGEGGNREHMLLQYFL